MQKKLMAVAVAGALGVPAVALAQTSTVQVFGTMYVEWSILDQANAAAPAGSPAGTIGAPLNTVDFIQTPGSEIGFKGEEKLGGGLSAWFQCASTADPRGQSQNGWCSRNSALGLKGGFGNVFVGNWDMPFKRAKGPTAVGSNETGIWGSSFLLTAGSTTTDLPPTGATPARATFTRRQNSSLTYDSPNFGGFQVMAAFTATQNATGTTSITSNNKARIMSIAGQYSAGPLFIGAGYEVHNDFNSIGQPVVLPSNPTANGRNGDDDAWFIGAAYTWGPVRFGGQYNQQKFETGTAVAPTDNKYKSWHFGVDWRIAGPHGLRASYTQVDDASGTPGAPAIAGNGATRPGVPTLAAQAAFGNNTGAKLYTVRYVYTLSKRTEFNFGYAKLDNDGNAGVGGAYRIGGGSAAITPGGSEDAWGASLRHTF